MKGIRIEYVYGVPCTVTREKFPDGYHDVYTFAVDGWSECSVTGLRAAKRTIQGRLDSAVRRTFGLDQIYQNHHAEGGGQTAR